MDVYLLSGLGADERLYTYLTFPDYCTPHYLAWLKPLSPQESMEEYCRRLSWQIDTGRPHIIIGTSFGGIVAQELAKITKPLKVVLLASIKHSAELPPYFRAFRPFGLHRFIPPKGLKSLAKFTKRAFGVKNDEGTRLFEDMVNKTPNEFMPWAIGQILQWRKVELSQDVIHIHGTKDMIFPVSYLKNYIPIKNGSHAMTMVQHEEISQIIGGEISKIQESLV